MDASLFLENFELIAETVGSVGRLREVILQLAVRGLLVEQCSSDEPATALLQGLRHQREELIRGGKVRRGKCLPPVEPHEFLFAIPTNWAWIRFDDVGDWGAGATPSRSKSEYFGGDISWFKSGELNDGYIDDSEEKITPLALKECSLRENVPGDVLVAMYGATIGKVAILRKPATTNQAVCACTCFDGVYNRFLLLLLKAFKTYFIENSAGAAQPNFSKEKIVRTPAPLPPLAEQRRIVAKVDQLLALCDELETRQQAQADLRTRLTRSAWASVTTATEPGDFATAWQRVTGHFDLLHDTPESVADLRQAILQLAVQGKLAEQNAGDKPAFLLVQRIRSQKQALIATNALKREKPLAELSEEELPFTIPQGWCWERLGNVCLNVTDGFHNTPKPTSTGIPYVTAQHVKPGGIDFENCLFVSEADHRELVRKTRVKKGDVLVVNIGAGCGIPAIVNVDFAFSFKNVAVLNCSENVNSEFLFFYLLSSLPSTLRQLTKGGAQPFLSLGTLRNSLLPVPPLSEQRRIVDRVKELLFRCDLLESQLAESQVAGEKLLASMVHHLLNAGPTEERPARPAKRPPQPQAAPSPVYSGVASAVRTKRKGWD